MGLFGRRRAEIPIKLTASNNNVILKIRKEWLVETARTDEAAANLLRLLNGHGDGDWSGADYPEIHMSLNHAGQLLKILETSALLCSEAG